MEMEPSKAIERLREWRKINDERDQRIRDAHDSRVSKVEIAKETGLSWQTIDRAVRDMAGTHNNEGGSQ